MIPVVLGLSGLIAKAAVVTAVSRVVKMVAGLANTPAPEAGADAPPLTAPPEPMAAADPVVEILASAQKTPPGRWQNHPQITRQTPSLLRWCAPAGARGPPLQIARSSFKASLHPRSYPINCADPKGLEARIQFSNGAWSAGTEDPNVFLAQLRAVKPGTISVIQINGHGAVGFAGFRAGWFDQEGLGINITGNADKRRIVIQSDRQVNFSELLEGKFDPNGQKRIELNNCFSLAGSTDNPSIGDTLAKSLPGITVSGWSGLTQPTSMFDESALKGKTPDSVPGEKFYAPEGSLKPGQFNPFGPAPTSYSLPFIVSPGFR